MLNFLQSRKGVHPADNKGTADIPSMRLTGFSKVRIPMSMHVGAPCTPIVSVGEIVAIGQKIGDNTTVMSVPIHSSVSGRITAIKRAPGTNYDFIEIETDGLDTVHDSVVPPEIVSRDSFIKAVRESGLVGLGGAGFPTHVKMNPPKGKEPDVLVINAAECEPFITSDYRLMLERPEEIVNGILAVLNWLNIPAAIIGVEDNKHDAAKLLEYQISKLNCSDKIAVKMLRTRYPQGAEKPLIFSTTGRRVPSGGLPHDVKVLVLNVGTVRYIDKYISTGMPLVRKRLTIDGGAVAHPANVSAPIGAFINDIVDKIGGTSSAPSKIIMGGPMMGISLDTDGACILKNNNAILLLSESQAAVPKELPCIRCSRCIDGCPMNLMPTSIDMMSRSGDVEGLKKYNCMDCIECGCCSYQCPSKRFLVQSIRSGKQTLRAQVSKT